MDPISIMALVGYIAGLSILILVWSKLKIIYTRVSVKRVRVEIILGAHIFFLHATVAPYFIPLPRLFSLISGTIAAILLPASTILLLLKFREMFTRKETTIQEIPWSLLGTNTGLLKLYDVWINSLLNLTKSALPTKVLRDSLASLQPRHPALTLLEISKEGKAEIQLERIDALNVDEIIFSYSLFINRIYTAYRAILGNHADDQIQSAFDTLLRSKPPILREKPQIVSYLFGGVLNGMSSTGTYLDVLLGGGIAKGETVVVVTPRGSTSDVLSDSFVAQGLIGGDQCHYVSSLKSPGDLRTRLSEMPVIDPKKVHIVDCNAFLTREVPKVIHLGEENTTLCPNFGLVDYALSQALGKGEDRRGRVVIDILPTWISLLREEGLSSIIISLSKIIEEIRRRGSTCIILLDPHLLEPQEEYLLAELMNNMIGLRVEGDCISIRIVKSKSTVSSENQLPFYDWTNNSVSGLIKRPGTANYPSEFFRHQVSRPALAEEA